MKAFDFRNGGWGWDVDHLKNINDTLSEVCGWARGISIGDYIIRKGTKAPVHISRVVTIRYENDPPDMFFATLENLGSCDSLEDFCESEGATIVSGNSGIRI